MTQVFSANAQNVCTQRVDGMTPCSVELPLCQQHCHKFFGPLYVNSECEDQGLGHTTCVCYYNSNFPCKLI